MHKREQGTTLRMPDVRPSVYHEQRLRAALLVAHARRSAWHCVVGNISNAITTMTPLQKGTIFPALALGVIIIGAGVFGPSAASVAHAEAQQTINRAFARFATLSEEDRAALQEKFENGMHLKRGDMDKHFVMMRDLTPDQIEEKHAAMRASLADSLAEAKAAPDVRIVSADELPRPGFVGRAGRAFGFTMNKHHEGMQERLATLPEDVRAAMEEKMAEHEQKKPVSFMVYTNPEGATVHLGLSEQDEPVVVFVQHKDGASSRFAPRMMPAGERLFRMMHAQEE